MHDISGQSIVIEYVGGKLNVHENPLGVMTNSPTFDWHMTNLRNYVNFSLTNVPPVQLGPVNAGFGQGRGCSDFRGTSPRLHVRPRCAFSQSVLPSKTGTDAVLQAFHVLNNFDIPKGAPANPKDDHGNIVADYTLWTSANDLKAKRFHFRTYENSQIRMVDLTKMNLDAQGYHQVSMQGDEVIQELEAPQG